MRTGGAEHVIGAEPAEMGVAEFAENDDCECEVAERSNGAGSGAAESASHSPFQHNISLMTS